MTEGATASCVLIPCSENERWAVPQNCLAEIQVVNSLSDDPPSHVFWRGCEVPVMDIGEDSGIAWREPRVGTGLVAIFLGLEGQDCEYWGVALRGGGLSMVTLGQDDIVDAPEEAADYASAAFRHKDVLYQVPDLTGLQKKIIAQTQAA